MQSTNYYNNQTDDIIIQGDNDQLKQVFINLIVNACEALEFSYEKFVTVNLKKEDDEYLTIEVIDSGAGIPEENLGKIFTPFFTTKKMGKGTGLGLAISYGIIKMHKGDIKVKSSQGKGTNFIIKLPFKLQTSNMIMN